MTHAPNNRWQRRLCATVLCVLSTTQAAEPPRKELWVPSKHWSEIQKHHPNAVNLTPEQYEALVRDASKTPPRDDPALAPPVAASIERILFKGRIDPASDTAQFTGEVIIRSLTDQWTKLDILLPFAAITSAASDMSDHLALGSANNDNVRDLLVRGKGLHHLFLEALAPITTLNESAKQSLPFHVSSYPGELQIELPAQATVIHRDLSLRRDGNTVHIPLNQPASKNQRIFNWSTGDTSMQRRVVSREPNTATIKLSEQTLTAQWSLTLEHLGTAPAERTLTLDVLPADTVIESITGDLVKQWKPLSGGKVELTIAANHGTTARLALTLSSLLNINDNAQPVPIPMVRSTEQITQACHARLDALDDALALLEQRGNLATWLPGEPAPQLVLRKAKPRIITDADALVTVTRDDIRIERTLAVSTDRAVNELRVTLPADELFDDTSSISGPAIEWKRIGQIIEYRWPAALTANAQSKLTLRTRKPLSTKPAANGEQRTENLRPLLIPDASKLTGYLALNYDATWRINITDTTGLEERDVKLTPVKGRMAWFSLRTFTLGFTVQRRDPVIDAEAVAYALPRARSIDIEGVLQLHVTDAPLREFKVRFEKTAAPQVRFTSDNISERKLDETTGEWTLTLRQEAQGMVPVRWSLSLAAGQKPAESKTTSTSDDTKSGTNDVIAAKNSSKSGANDVMSTKNDSISGGNDIITYTLPSLSLPTARRFTGTWVIEANTDTEITFTPKTMQPLDVLHVPVIDGYQPRHRLVAAYTYASADAVLTLHAARHGHSELAALVVNSLALRTVLAPDGTTRHEATLQVQHSGEQYVTIALPDNATLLSALAGGQPVKPVRGPNGSLSIPLPPTSANEPNVEVRLLYETTEPPWTATGQRKLAPPTIPGNVPILATDWEVFTPDGYSFGKVKTDLEQEGTGISASPWLQAIRSFSPTTFLAGGGERRMLAAITEDEMEEIHPKFPKPMFVGTPVPAPDGFKTVEPRQSEFARKVEEVQRSLQKANSYSDLGDYDNATKEFQSALRTDPNNAAARRGLERIEKQKVEYTASARDHQRSKMLNQAGAGWVDSSNPKSDMFGLPQIATKLTDVRQNNTAVVGFDFITGTETSSKSGLLTLLLDLPTAGQRLHFRGLQAPTTLELGYRAWERQVTWACVLMFAGAGLFIAWGRRRPVMFTLLAVLVLAMGVSLTVEDWQPSANALLLGWLAALGIALVWRTVNALSTWITKRRALIATCAVALCTSVAAESPALPSPSAHTVFVPFDETKPPQSQIAQRYFLDRADFERLWSLAKENRKPAIVADPDGGRVAAHVHSALYRASIEEQSLRIEARYEITTLGAWASADVTLHDASAGNTALPVIEVFLDDQPAALEDGKLRIEKPGTHKARIRYALARNPGWQGASLTLPQVAASMLRLDLPATDGAPEFGDASLLVTEEARAVTVALGNATKLDFKRKPVRPLVAAPPPIANIDTTVELDDDQRTTATVLATYTFPGASRRELELTLDPEWDIQDVFLWSGDWRKDIRLHQTEAGGKRALHLTTTRDLNESARITLVLHPRSADKPKSTPLIVPLSGKHEATATLASTTGIEITAAPTNAQIRLANKPWTIGEAKVQAITYRLTPGGTLSFDAKTAAAKTEARTDYVIQLSEQKREVFAAITLKRQRGTWQQLRVDLPAEGFEVQAVNGTNLTAWEQVGDQVFIRFGADAGTETRLVVYAATALAKATSQWVLTPMRLDGVEKIKGTAIIAAHSAVETKLPTDKPLVNAREVDSSMLNAVFTITPPIAKQRALEFERGDWSAVVSLQEQPVRFAADGVLLVQASDTGLLVSQQIALGVEQGALKHVIVRLPKALPEATVSGDVLREARPGIVGEFREYDCTFQSQGGLQGHTSLTFDMHLPLTDTEQAIPFVEVADASRVRRWVVLDNASAREMTITKSDGVEPTTRDTLPYIPQILAQPRYYTAKNAGGLSAFFKQLQASAGNAAIVTLADISTVLRADGERWDTVVYSVQNRTLQFLPVVLPEGAELIAVSVSGEAVRADEARRDGRRVRLIPMIQTRPGQTSMEVHLVYRIKAGAFAAALHFDDPEVIGISAERTIWTVTVPKGCRVDDRFTTLFGNMEMISAEGHGVERLNKMLSDFQTMNRYLGSGANDLSEADNKRVVEEARKLGEQINLTCQQVMTENRIQQPLFNTRKVPQQQQWQQQVDAELGQVSKELQRQNELLTTNGSRQGTTSLNRVSGTVANGWASNAPSFPMTPTTPTAFEQSSLVGFNDNVGVKEQFFAQKGTLTLNGANTYAGATTINAGTTVQALGDLPVLGKLFKSATPTQGLVANNSRAFNAAGNVQLNGGVQEFDPPQIPQMMKDDRPNRTTVNSVGGSYGAQALNGGGEMKNLGETSAAATDPFGKADNPMSRGTRFGTAAITPDSVDGLISANPKPAAALSPKQYTVGGVVVADQEKIVEELKREADKVRKEPGVVPAAPADSFAAAGSSGNTTFGTVSGTAIVKSGAGALAIAPAAPAPKAEPKKRAERALDQIVDLQVAAAGKDGEKPTVWASQPGAIRVYEDNGEFANGRQLYTTQQVNQLRPTGRRSLAIAVPTAGEVFHFRKLKDHAVLDLTLKHDWPQTKVTQATTFGAGLGLWVLLSLFIARRTKRAAR